MKAYIGIGSNLNRPIQQVQAAIQHLQRLKQTQWLGCSAIYQSVPLSNALQPAYMNCVAAVDTQLSAIAFLEQLLSIEALQGRIRTKVKHDNRTLDLDLLLFGEQQMQTTRLTLPHPGLLLRDFVLYPLYELAGNLLLPKKLSLLSALLQIPLTLKKIKPGPALSLAEDIQF